VFREQGYRIEDFPVAYDQYSREISLPVYPQLTDEQIHFVVQTIDNAYHKVVRS
jgi:dTDP-4-amino-4,6-dideoxygalactose transaminase